MPRKPSRPSAHQQYPTPQIGPIYLDETFRLNRQAIRHLLQVLHWQQSDLADYMGVSPVTVNRWVQGTRHPNSHHESELVRLVQKTNRQLELHGGSIPPEQRWLPPRLAKLKAAGAQVLGVEPPISEARLINAGLAAEREAKAKEREDDQDDE